MVFCFRARARYTDGGRGCYSRHRTQGYIAQWLERLTADQQVPGSINVTNQIILMFNNMSPIRTVITTITRKSVKMVAELRNDTAPSRILDTTVRLEDYSAVVALNPPSEFGADTVVH